MSGAANFNLHRATEDWGEGASDAGDPGGIGTPAAVGDATWAHRFFSTQAWATAGGSFAGTASATTSVDGKGSYLWTAGTLLADVGNWRSAPATNFGWVLVGNEAANSAKRFISGEGVIAGERPQLVISHLSAPPLTRRETWLQQYFPAGQFVDDFADLDGDTINNQLEYGFSLSPIVRNPGGISDAVTVVAQPGAGGMTDFNLTFRRDPRATDLTYELQTSPDLIAWSTIVRTVAGAAPFGDGYVSESDAPGEAPVKIVVAREVLASDVPRFARVRILRQP